MRPFGSPGGAAVTVEALTQRFDTNTVLDQIDLRLAPGRVLALLGPSGCGKTTLLKLLAGLLVPTSGRIAIGERAVAGPGVFVPSEKRGLGMVFQDYALWPHMTVQANVAFALRMRGTSRSTAAKRADAMLDQVGLTGFGPRRPGQLSGGQQQRVALARALISEPKLLLFDEPLSNLDRDLRENLCLEIARLLRAAGTTAVYVTHDHEEAFTLANEVAMMDGGRIRQLDTPEKLIHDPASADIAAFLKQGTVLPGTRTNGGWQLANGIRLESAVGLESAPTGPGHLYIPHTALTPSTEPSLRGEVLAQRYRAGHYATDILLPGDTNLAVTMLTGIRLQPGAAVGLTLDWQRLRWWAQAA